ncbi:Lactyl (2) diphospho-(5')guanosine transferase [Serinicoccus hydrothermalis]|uniref:Lactyl (2) diphospho-(5')guanosine transferase n=1 Tax=Serinicoccus hydrothermalis TaxID=1758689 RepID=A0A1B1NAH3_9MICO|nr:2-phospho-L-lactate transferase [Serinicoccus hydrothermalis]ANS78429.1 Lactyl (2) diphospho-(5')guanosine transferase [Serinicoccus hydrothermalis]
MQITVLAGGVGGARFVRGLLSHLRTRDDAEQTSVTVVGNTGDDITLVGLRVCPDLDTLLYTLGDGVDEGQGWGRAQESTRVAGELATLGVGPDWFTLGDLDLATHLARSRWLAQGLTLSEVTARLAQRWGLPDRGVRLLPATDTPIETHVVVDDGEGGERAIHFQEWWVRHGASLPARRFTVAGLGEAKAAPHVLDALRTADVVLFPPSNPVVSIGIILGVPGVREALRGTRAPVVGVSPLLGGRPVRGHADACLAPLGVEVSAAGVAGLYADFLDGWLVDDADAGLRYPAGAQVRSMDLLMRDTEGAARLAGAALDLGRELSPVGAGTRGPR